MTTSETKMPLPYPPTRRIDVTERHFGLGDKESVDVVVTFHPSGKRVEKQGVKADTTIVIEE